MHRYSLCICVVCVWYTWVWCMLTDVLMCVSCMLAGVGGECWVFSAIVLCLVALGQGLLLKKKHHSCWADRLESSQCQSASFPWCWDCRHIHKCVFFYMGTRDLNSGSHACHTSHTTHWAMCPAPQYTQKVKCRSKVLFSVVPWSGFGTSSMLIPYILFISQRAPSERDERLHYFFLSVRKLCIINLFSWVDAGLFPLMWV